MIPHRYRVMCKWKLERKMSKMTCWWVFFHSCRLYTHSRFLFHFYVKCFNFDWACAQLQHHSKYLGSNLTPIQRRWPERLTSCLWGWHQDREGSYIPAVAKAKPWGHGTAVGPRIHPHSMAQVAVGPGSFNNTTSATNPPCFSTGAFLLYSPSSLPVSGTNTSHFHSWHHTVI